MSRQRASRVAALLLSAVGLGAAGLTLVTDRPGLTTEYYPATPSFEGEPVARRITPPRLQNRLDLGRYLHDRDYCSVRWRGSLRIDQAGRHLFRLDADEAAYLRLDGRPLLDSSSGPGREAEAQLAAGVHQVEIGLAQTGGEVRLETLWTPPDGRERPLDAELLFAGSAPAPRRWMRRLLEPLPALGRRLTGAALLLAALLAASRLARREPAPAIAKIAAALDRFRASSGRRRAAWLTLLVAGSAFGYRLLERAGGSPFGYDDTRYMAAALAVRRIGWMADRYTHVYLVRLFQQLVPESPFAGAVALWAFLMTATMIALAVAVRALGPGLRLRTLAVTLLLLFAQKPLFERAGTIWSDYTAMLLITAAVAVYLHRFAAGRSLRYEIHSLAIGALTLLAFRSKPTGAVLLWLLLLMLWERGRIDLRGFVRKFAFWLAGLLAALLLLMTLDAWMVGDALFSLRSGPIGSVVEIHLGDEVDTQQDLLWVWIDQVWPVFIAGKLWIPGLLPLGLLVLGAAFAASATRQPIELRLLHLMPFAYLGGLIALQLKGTYGALPRHLFPIVPTAVLLGAALASYAGLEKLSLRDLTAPRLLLPLGALASVGLVVVLPAQTGGLGAADLGGVGIAPGLALVGPASLLALALAAPLVIARPGGPAAVTLTALLLAFGPSFAATSMHLETRQEAQRAAHLLYPWAAFGAEIETPARVVVDRQIVGGPHGLFGPARTLGRVANLSLRRADLEVTVDTSLLPAPDYAIGGVDALESWRREIPGIEETAVAEPSGRLFLVRPKLAASDPDPPGPATDTGSRR